MSQTKRERLKQLQAQKDEKTAQLDQVRKSRAAALVEGTDLSQRDELVALESDLAVLKDAIAIVEEQARLEEQREQAAEEIEALTQRQKAIDKAVVEYAAAVASAEAAMKEVVQSLLAIDAHAAALVRLAPKPPGQHDWASIGPQNVQMRLSERMARAMAPLSSNGVYGQFKWATYQPRSEHWSHEERDTVDRELAMSRRLIFGRISELRATLGKATND